MLISLAQFFYFLFISLGWFVAVDRSAGLWLRKRRIDDPAMVVMLAFALFPVVVTWLALANVFTHAFMTVLASILLAALGLWEIAQNRVAWCMRLRVLQGDAYMRAVLWLLALFVATLLVTRYCYFSGGINTHDDLRGIFFTSNLAASHLKPGFPINPGLPLSYGYYLYQISAFFYASTHSVGWPSVALLVTNLWAVACFYFGVAMFVRRFDSAHAGRMTFWGLLIVSFYGLDLFVNPNALDQKHIEWWNTFRINQTASAWHWVYHYLAAMGFALMAMVALDRSYALRRKEYLELAVLFGLAALTFGAITGVFAAFVLIACWLWLYFRSPAAMLRMLFRAIPGLAVVVVVMLAPQFFTFVDRQGLIGLSASPALLFSRIPFSQATVVDIFQDIKKLFFETGVLGIIGLVGAGVAVRMLVSRAHESVYQLVVMFIVSLLGAMFIAPTRLDMMWHGPLFFLAISTLLLALLVWGYAINSLSGKRKSQLLVVLLLPGMVNFYAEQWFRFRSCQMPSPEVQQVHAQVPADFFVIAGRDMDFAWAVQAGRGVSGPDAAGWFGQFEHYRNSDAFLKHFFDWTPGKWTPCGVSATGYAAPSGRYVVASRDGGRMQFDHYFCDFKK